jgi:3-deoxy-manno-octulosonate cytidylyltransferase (CMP-KDO synthetase)
MKELNYVVIIPARYGSSRLEGKPLVNLCGVPMIVRTYLQCIKACPPEKVFVACDDERIKTVCELHDIQVLMTSSDCLTGTDRVAECAQQLDADVYINVQGDEPVFNPEDLDIFINTAQKFPTDVLNGVCKINDEALFRSGTIPKAVMRADGRLLYMSRAGIPTNKKHEFITSWRQVCVYAFPKKSLEAFKAQKVKTPLEQIEDIEILRFLELGWEVRMVPLSTQSVAVDTPEDIVKVEQVIQQRGL